MYASCLIDIKSEFCKKHARAKLCVFARFLCEFAQMITFVLWKN